jgi:hypothetical protein
VSSAAPWLAGLLPLALAACLNVNYVHYSIDQPLDDAVLATLTPDRDDLAACLARLGAPRYVWEQPHDGFALAYGWLDEADWGLSASWAPREFSYGSASFEFDSTASDFVGVVLLFDGTLRLRIRRGYLREIANDLRQRPADPDQD